MTDDCMDDIPTFCVIPAEQRRAAWERNPPTPMPSFNKPRNEDADTAAFRARQEELSKAKAYSRIGAMKAKQATPVDLSKVRWDGSRCRWVPLTPAECSKVTMPKAKPIKRRSVAATKIKRRRRAATKS